MVKTLPANAGDARDVSLITGSGRFPEGANGTPLQFSCLENSLGREAWRATVHGAAKGRHNWVTEHIQTSMKEIKNFIQVILRIITQEWPLRKLWELFCPLEVKAQLSKFFGTEGYTLNDILLIVYTILICKCTVMGHHNALQNQEGMSYFKKLLCWYWENAIHYGWAGMSA